MIPIALAVLLGTLCLQLLPQLPPAPFAWCLVPAVLIAGVFRRSRPVAWCLLGFLGAWCQAEWRLSADLPAALEGQDLLLRGAIVSLPERDARATRFVFRAQALQRDGEWVAFNTKVRLSWYDDAPALAAGDGWQLRVRLKRRQGFYNFGGFDYPGWLFQKGIGATGYVRKSAQTEPHPAAASRDPTLLLRAKVERRLGRALTDVRQVGLIRALAIGATDRMDSAQWAVFRATGTTHLVSISGLHIGLVAGLGFALGRWLWGRSHRLTLRRAAPYAGAVLGLVLATLYTVLAGFGVPARRSWIMVLVVLSALLWQRPTRPAQGLALALLLVTLFDPFAVMSPGFWLSFVAVAIIFSLTARGATARASHWRRLATQTRLLVRMQWTLSLGLLPLLLLFFGQTGWVAPIANLFAVPWTSLVLVPLVFAGLLLLYPAPWLAHGAFWLAGWTAELLDLVLGWLAALPGSTVGMPLVPVPVFVAAALGVTLLLLPRGTPHRLVGGLLLLPLATWTPPRPASDTAWLTLLDVGQGLAAVVQTQRHTLVYDAGPRFSADFDTGAAVVAPFLFAVGVRHIDHLVISHGDNDHRGGAASLDRLVPAFRLSSSVPGLIDWRYGSRCQAGQRWEWDGVRFEMLHPQRDANLDGNDASCVLQIEARGERLLLSGDIEAAAERELVREYGDRLRSDILIAPHHGSRTSSTPAFVAAVDPRWVLFAAGYRNRYGFPKPEVQARYRARGSQALITAETGAIQLRLGEGLRQPPALERERAPRYWQLPATVPPSP
ncbi:MAG: DNA internalization-related competence protein ComEC/Rec2 [Novosphingobium sp.]